jgi:hypothetical protein
LVAINTREFGMDGLLKGVGRKGPRLPMHFVRRVAVAIQAIRIRKLIGRETGRAGQAETEQRSEERRWR